MSILKDANESYVFTQNCECKLNILRARLKAHQMVLNGIEK